MSFEQEPKESFRAFAAGIRGFFMHYVSELALMYATGNFRFCDTNLAASVRQLQWLYKTLFNERVFNSHEYDLTELLVVTTEKARLEYQIGQKVFKIATSGEPDVAKKLEMYAIEVAELIAKPTERISQLSKKCAEHFAAPFAKKDDGLFMVLTRNISYPLSQLAFGVEDDFDRLGTNIDMLYLASGHINSFLEIASKSSAFRDADENLDRARRRQAKPSAEPDAVIWIIQQ